MDVFNPKNILLCLLSKQTGAHSSMHGVQCNWANHLCKDLSSSEQCEFKRYELKPSILDEGLSSEGSGWCLEPVDLCGNCGIFIPCRRWQSLSGVVSRFEIPVNFYQQESHFSIETPCSLLPTYEKFFLLRYLLRLHKVGRYWNRNLLKVKVKMTRS